MRQRGRDEGGSQCRSVMDRIKGESSTVSGRSKPATEGRLKTSHFEETQVRRLGSGASPLPQEPDLVEPAQDGRPRNHPYPAPPRLVPAPHRRRAGDQPRDRRTSPPTGGPAVKTSPCAPRRDTGRRRAKTSPCAPRLGGGRGRGGTHARDPRLDTRSAAPRRRSGQRL